MRQHTKATTPTMPPMTAMTETGLKCNVFNKRPTYSLYLSDQTGISLSTGADLWSKSRQAEYIYYISEISSIEIDHTTNLDPRDKPMTRENKEYISLKEASEISGYSPDYIGQLIRSGKLPGKQIFQQVVWMTTEEDLRSYMERKRTMMAAGTKEAPVAWTKRLLARGRHSVETPRFAIRVLYGAMIAAVLLFLLLFYVFSSSIEQHMSEQAMQAIEASSTP